MPPRLWSRHTFTTQLRRLSDGAVFLTDRERFLYVELADNISHIVVDGDSLHSIAAQNYAELSDPPHFSGASLWWAIADFQPIPIHDPTIVLTSGTTIIVPSLRTVMDKIFNPAVRTDGGTGV